MSDIINKLIVEETKRQNDGLELIASENYCSLAVRQAVGSILTNKYAEGYPGHRYYGGCGVVDDIEQYCQELACSVFKCKYANVQPHSGSQANFAAYRALMPNGGKILSLSLDEGGHLTHGSPVSFSGNLYTVEHYKLGKDGKLDFAGILAKAEEFKPDVIVAGYSAYPYKINFLKFKEIAVSVNAKLMVDMSHIAGLVATGYHENPFPFADIVTTTTHKTLRGPRGGMILTNDETLYKAINKAIFPYSQGGPLMHVIAGKAVALEEASTGSFDNYISEVLLNTEEACEYFKANNRIVAGTDNHLFLLETYKNYGLTGKEAQELLEKCNITTNKNMMPGDTLSPNETSGLRIGFAALTTRGCTQTLAIQIASIIDDVLCKKLSRFEAKEEVSKIVQQLCCISNL